MKRLAYIFIPILAILLMSHNSSAVSMVIDYDNYENVYYLARDNVDCVINGVSYNNQGFCSSNGVTGDVRLTKLVAHTGIPVKVDDIVTFKVIVFSRNDLVFNYGISYINNQVEGYGRVIGFNEIVNDDLSDYTYLDIGLDSSSPGDIEGGNYISRVYEYYVLMGRNLGNFQIGLTSSNSGYPIMSWYSGAPSDYLNFKILDINQFRYKGSNTNEEQRQATQDAADNASSSGSSSESSAEAATSSLISVIGGFVSVVTSATPTNCLIDADLNHIDMGNIDLCANPVPSYIQIIGSIILICAVIPLAIILFNRFIGLFRSFQG